MSNRSLHILTPDILLRAYAAGIFPMAENAQTSDLVWFDPPIRALIPLDDQFHISKRLKRTLRHNPFTMKMNTAFSQVIRSCATPSSGRSTTWINREIYDLYCTLHWRGHAHSIEAWQGTELVGGLYGVSLGSAFFGESMFSRKNDASKIALVHLVALLRHCHFDLLDTQFQTDHLAQFGTFEVTRMNYHHLLADSIRRPAQLIPPKDATGKADWGYLLAPFLQPVIQRS